MDDDLELGRGNRIRKKRKFFDDENDNLAAKKAMENVIRKDIFSPEIPAEVKITEDRNSAFLKPLTSSVKREMVKDWNSAQVAKFIVEIPRLSCDLPKLENKIVEEEIDGEAFLLMTQSDFVNTLGMKLGPAIKIYNALLLVKNS